MRSLFLIFQYNQHSFRTFVDISVGEIVHGVEDDTVGVREIFSMASSNVVGVEISFVVSSDD